MNFTIYTKRLVPAKGIDKSIKRTYFVPLIVRLISDGRCTVVQNVSYPHSVTISGFAFVWSLKQTNKKKKTNGMFCPFFVALGGPGILAPKMTNKVHKSQKCSNFIPSLSLSVTGLNPSLPLVTVLLTTFLACFILFVSTFIHNSHHTHTQTRSYYLTFLFFFLLLFLFLLDFVQHFNDFMQRFYAFFCRLFCFLHSSTFFPLRRTGVGQCFYP